MEYRAQRGEFYVRRDDEEFMVTAFTYMHIIDGYILLLRMRDTYRRRIRLAKPLHMISRESAVRSATEAAEAPRR